MTSVCHPMSAAFVRASLLLRLFLVGVLERTCSHALRLGSIVTSLRFLHLALAAVISI